MPELPEVEAARQVVERSALDRVVAAVDDRDTYVCRPHPPGEVEHALLGRRLVVAHRRGKLMWCETSGVDGDDDPGPALGVHLGMSGRVLVSPPSSTEGGDDAGTARSRSARVEPKPEWDRFTVTFEDGGRLRLFDKRRLARVRLDPDLDHLGPDAAEIDRESFRARVGRGSAPLKARLLDQATVAGVGNLLADEVLWQSRLSPQRPAGGLDAEELDELRRALRAAVRRALRRGGVHTGEIIAHRRAEGHCPRCGAAMRRASVGGRTTWWCPEEQR